MHVPSLFFFLLPILAATTALAQYPTTSPEELKALKYPTINTEDPSTSDPVPPNSNNDDETLTKRRSHYYGIYICNQEHWRGDCWYAPQNGNACQNWDNIHSFGPDNGVACDIFEGENCRGKMVMKFITYPGVDTTPGNGLKSFRCGSH